LLSTLNALGIGAAITNACLLTRAPRRVDGVRELDILGLIAELVRQFPSRRPCPDLVDAASKVFLLLGSVYADRFQRIAPEARGPQ
jgi:hypothetical protein